MPSPILIPALLTVGVGAFLAATASRRGKVVEPQVGFPYPDAGLPPPDTGLPPPGVEPTSPGSIAVGDLVRLDLVHAQRARPPLALRDDTVGLIAEVETVPAPMGAGLPAYVGRLVVVETAPTTPGAPPTRMAVQGRYQVTFAQADILSKSSGGTIPDPPPPPPPPAIDPNLLVLYRSIVAESEKIPVEDALTAETTAQAMLVLAARLPPESAEAKDLQVRAAALRDRYRQGVLTRTQTAAENLLTVITVREPGMVSRAEVNTLLTMARQLRRLGDEPLAKWLEVVATYNEWFRTSIADPADPQIVTKRAEYIAAYTALYGAAPVGSPSQKPVRPALAATMGQAPPSFRVQPPATLYDARSRRQATCTDCRIFLAPQDPSLFHRIPQNSVVMILGRGIDEWLYVRYPAVSLRGGRILTGWVRPRQLQGRGGF